MASDGNLEIEDGVSVLVNDDFGELIAETGKDFPWYRGDQVADVVDPVTTTSAVLFFQARLTYCFVLAF